MIKIGHVEDVESLSLSKEIKAITKEITTILDLEYGKNRDIDKDLGGYVIVIESSNDFKKLKDIYIDIHEVIPEYVDLVNVKEGEGYCNALILLNNDFAVSLIIPISITPQNLLDEIQ